MLISGLFILLLVSAISQERINGIILNRAATLVLFYSFIISISTLDVSIIGSGIGIYGGLYQVTVVSKIVECFIYLLGAIILSNTMLLTALESGGRTGKPSALVPSTAQETPCIYPKHSLTSFQTSEDRGGSSVTLAAKSEYSIIALFTVIGGVLLISSNDLISMYLSIELQSFGLYVLATIYRDSQSATYAGLKYFLLGGLSSGFILLGSSIIYAYTGITNLEGIYLLISTAGQGLSLPVLDSSSGLSLTQEVNEIGTGAFFSFRSTFRFVEIGMLVMAVGFLFKVASAPFHNWAPDVYDGVPTKVTTWLAIMAKISILTFLLDLSVGSGALLSVGGGTLSTTGAYSLILICSLLSLLVGTIVGLAQYRIKRLLAYSTISHVGFLLLAIAINTEDSIESFIFYLIQYSLTSANAFFVLIAFGGSISAFALASTSNLRNEGQQEYSPVEFISQLKGQFTINPLLALSMAITLFSMAGIPPLVGFFAKQAVLLAAVKNGFIFLALVGIVTSVISAAYYLRVIKVMHFDSLTSSYTGEAGFRGDKVLPQIEEFPQGDSQTKDGEMSNSLSFSISILTILTLFFVLKPTLILNSAHIMALSLFYL